MTTTNTDDGMIRFNKTFLPVDLCIAVAGDVKENSEYGIYVLVDINQTETEFIEVLTTTSESEQEEHLERYSKRLGERRQEWKEYQKKTN